MRGLIAAVSPEGVIGLDGKIPWHYKGDLRRFKRITMGSTIIMGRLTWESIGKKALPGRRNIVITSRSDSSIDCYPDLISALASTTGPGDVWFIGGARVYKDAMRFVEVLDITRVPDCINDPNAVRFPAIDPAVWYEGPLLVHADEPALRRQIFTRRSPL